jgi:uncharacterized protein
MTPIRTTPISSAQVSQTDDRVPPIDDAENSPASPANSPTIGDLIEQRYSRREMLRGSLAVAAIAAAFPKIADSIVGSTAHAAAPSVGSFDFKELAAGSDASHHVAAGYDANVLIRWGDRVTGDAPPFDIQKQGAASQAAQFGYNNDFIGYIPLNERSDHGLLVVNHEYTNDDMMFPGIGVGKTRAEAARDMPVNLIEAAMQAHGGSVVEVKRDATGTWSIVDGARYNRRITATTPMQMSGPARGHDRLKTKADPDGTAVLGMLNNCAGGLTPWGTWLTCEENINYYFANMDAAKASPNAAKYERFGLPPKDFAYPWAKADTRFDIGVEPNESNRFGWVVEIDPMDPSSTPVKRTALGRFKHEGAGNTVNGDGRFVVYQGDDQVFEYIYRFVSENKVDPTNRENNKDLLDRGTLFVARFDADGHGQWLPLVHGHEKLAAFPSQADILIDARLAADALGATRMDRPEDIEVNPKTGKVYAIMTKNAKREETGDKGVNPANPRSKNRFGHIIEITPDGGDHAAVGFKWDILVKCGDPSIAAVGATFNPATTADGWFGSPDNCAIDSDGRLWIATDGNSPSETGRADGLWSMETDGPLRGTSKLFFRCPNGAELCGPFFTPDMETLFVSVQHPGEPEDGQKSTFDNPSTRWPDFKDDLPPRPSVVVITRTGGGKIGA